MKSRRRNREAFAENSFWQSYSDMMAALLLIFILIIAITLAVYRQKNTDLQKSEYELGLAKQEIEDAKKLLYNAQQELDNYRLEIDKSNQELAFSLAQLQQAYDEAALTRDALTAESKVTLKEVIPTYLDVLLQDRFRGYIAEIIVEGHTDTQGDYAGNMKLSYQRAYSVAEFCIDEKNGLSRDKIAQLTSLLTVNGRSWSHPVYVRDAQGNNTSQVDMAASRRVEIKFRLKEDEMIEKISQILQQQ